MKLYYGFDTLCVFSYGFNPLMNKLYKSFGDQITFELLPAGMWRGEDEKVLTNLSRKNLRQSIQRVGKMTGQPYGEAFIKHLKSLDSLNSYYGAKAMNTIMTFDSVDPFDYLASLYKKTFVEGKNTSDESLFCDTAKEFDIDGNEFLQRLRSDEIETLTLSKIDKLLELGIESYPTLLIDHDGNFETYPLNYDSYEALENWLKKYI